MKAISGIGARLLDLMDSLAVVGQAMVKPATSPTAVHAAEAAPTQTNAAQLKTGEATYKAACLACHQPGTTTPTTSQPTRARPDSC